MSKAKKEKENGNKWDFVRVNISYTELVKLGLTTASKKEAMNEVREKLHLPRIERVRHILGLDIATIDALGVKPDAEGKYDRKEIVMALVKKRADK